MKRIILLITLFLFSIGTIDAEATVKHHHKRHKVHHTVVRTSAPRSHGVNANGNVGVGVGPIHIGVGAGAGVGVH